MASLDFLTRARGALLGLAAGDALGTTLEFRPPGLEVLERFANELAAKATFTPG